MSWALNRDKDGRAMSLKDSQELGAGGGGSTLGLWGRQRWLVLMAFSALLARVGRLATGCVSHAPWWLPEESVCRVDKGGPMKPAGVEDSR